MKNPLETTYTGLLNLPDQKDSFSVITLIRKGIPKKSLLYFRKQTGFPIHLLASTMSIDEKTIYRKKTTDKFDDYASERLLKLAEITAFGINVFGSTEKFMGWMNTPIRPLGHRKPIELLDTIYGLELISDEIGRIQHGVYA